MNYQMRYDEKRGIYRDCKWCGGTGCLACPAEAEKEYQRQFPDGPKPILALHAADFQDGAMVEMLKSLIGPDAIMAAKAEGEKRAELAISEHPEIAEIAGCTTEQAKSALATDYTGQIIHENIVKSGLSNA